MIDREALRAELEATWHRDIPLVTALATTIDSYDGTTLIVRAPLQPNRNLHGTAFAGSLYSVCVLTGWGATWLALREHRLEGSIVVATSSIDFRKAVSSDLVCRCQPDAAALAAALEQLRRDRRARLDLTCTLDQGAARAVTFTGTYAMHAPRH